MHPPTKYESITCLLKDILRFRIGISGREATETRLRLRMESLRTTVALAGVSGLRNGGELQVPAARAAPAFSKRRGGGGTVSWSSGSGLRPSCFPSRGVSSTRARNPGQTLSPDRAARGARGSGCRRAPRLLSSGFAALAKLGGNSGV